MQKSDLIYHLHETLPKITTENGYQTQLGAKVLYGIDVRSWQGEFELQWIDEITRPSEKLASGEAVEIVISAIGYCDRSDALGVSTEIEEDLRKALRSVSCLAGGQITVEKTFEQGSEFGAVEVLFRIIYQVL